MAKKRATHKVPSQQRDQLHRVARSPSAVSRSRVDVAYLARPPSAGVAETVHRAVLRPVSRRTVTQPASRPGLPGQPASAIFGPWSIGQVRSAFTCARRYVRRSVLFATRSTGKGSRARRRHFSNQRC